MRREIAQRIDKARYPKVSEERRIKAIAGLIEMRKAGEIKTIWATASTISVEMPNAPEYSGHRKILRVQDAERMVQDFRKRKSTGERAECQRKRA